MKGNNLKGIFPYLVTPTDEKGNVNEDVLFELVEHLINSGIHGITPLGSTGEGAYLDWPRKKKVVETVVKAAGGRIPVVAGVNCLTTEGAVHEAAAIEQLGVDGILTVLPSYFPIAEEQIVHHFRSVAQSVSCSVTLYTNPNFALWDFTIDSLKLLMEEENILYLKDASGNIAKLMSIVTALGDRLKVFSATAHVPLFVFMLGGVGWMAGPACLIPRLCISLYELACQKKYEEALKLQKKLWPLNQAFKKYSLAACVKAGLELQGFKVGRPLLPQKQLDSRAIDDVRRILEKVNKADGS